MDWGIYMDSELNNEEVYSDDIEMEFDNNFEDIDDNQENTDNEVNNDDSDDEIIESNVNDSSTGVIDDKYKKKISSEEARELSQKLEHKLEELKEADREVSRTRAFGDLSENEAYDHAKTVLRELQYDIEKIKYELSHSIVEDNKNSNKVIGRGSKVDITITDPKNIMKTQNVRVIIVSAGHGELLDTGELKIPDTSEVYRKMEDKQDGQFNLTGTDGNVYHYEFRIVRGD